jgi:hypothetical protein
VAAAGAGKGGRLQIEPRHFDRAFAEARGEA